MLVFPYPRTILELLVVLGWPGFVLLVLVLLLAVCPLELALLALVSALPIGKKVLCIDLDCQFVLQLFELIFWDPIMD